jgi:hypothetical protein
LGKSALTRLNAVHFRSNRTAVLSTIDFSNDAELFFGMRGAGGMLAIAVSMTVKTYPAPPQVCAKFGAPITDG